MRELKCLKMGGRQDQNGLLLKGSMRQISFLVKMRIAQSLNQF